MSAPDRNAPVGTAPESISELLRRFPSTPPPRGTAGAAVTIVLRDGEHGVEALLIERTVRETDIGSGQVGLPGGRVTEEDDTMRTTALRELEEEVGLTLDDLAGEPVYVSTETARAFSLRVTVFAAELRPHGGPPTVRSSEEVAHVFWLPRAALGSTRAVDRETIFGIRPVEATIHEGHVLWGFTRRVLRQFFGLPGGEGDGPAFAPHATPHP